MQNVLWGMLLVFAVTSHAGTPEKTFESWRVGEDYVVFVNFKHKGMKISKGCEDAKSNCQVWKILAAVSTKQLGASDLIGGKNPGASLCHKQKNAQILFARNVKGRQGTFCVFSDGSMVDSGGLLMAAKMNDAKKAGQP